MKAFYFLSYNCGGGAGIEEKGLMNMDNSVGKARGEGFKGTKW